MMQIAQMIKKYKLIAIVRGIDPEEGLKTAQALYRGGIRLMEVTFDQKDPQKQQNTVALIESMCRYFGDQVAVGAGTVTSPELVEKAAAAGAKYIISPDVCPAVIQKTKQLGLLSIPGALTPSEITAAYRYGADFVKLFPVSALGPGYVKAVTAPLNHIPLLAVGGINGENVAQYLRAGCCGAGVGGNLVNKDWIKAGEFDKITACAAQLVAAAEE